MHMRMHRETKKIGTHYLAESERNHNIQNIHIIQGGGLVF